MLLDINKMKMDIKSKSQLPENLLDSLVKNSCEYFTSLDKELDKVKPTEIVDVISILANFKEYFSSESEWERLTLHSLNVLRKGINASIFHDYAVFSGITHVAFSIYELSVTTPKIQSFLDSIIKLLLENLSSYLEGANKEKFKTSGNFEVISGLSGPLRFLLNFNDDSQMKNVACQIIDAFIKRSKDITILGHRTSGWHYYPSEVEASFMYTKSENGCINYGLSHGMGGPLVTLSLAYKNGIRKEGLLDAIDGLVEEYMQAVYYANDIAYWPGRVIFEQYIGLEEIQKSPNQMSWCYGSVGILRALYMSGIFTSNKKVAQFALSELIKITEMDLTDYLLVQPIVCHGFAGTAAIMNLMYLDTGKAEFLNKTIEMLEIAAQLDIKHFFENEKQIATERNASSRASLYCYLEGYGGIINTILSIAKGVSNENEKRLLVM